MVNNKIKIILFGGTSEGRIIAEILSKSEKVNVTVCVATEYGEEMLPDIEGIFVKKGRMDKTQIEEFLSTEQAEICIDATHPYATVVSENVMMACESLQVKYIRVTRDEQITGDNSVIQVKTQEEAAKYLACQEGNILVTTGSKELSAFDCIEGHERRCFVRVLPSEEAMVICREHGYSGRNVIAMHGPFSQKLNEAIIKECNIKWLVTKNSGSAGGFMEKYLAAKECDIGLVVIDRPAESTLEAVSMSGLFEILETDYGIEKVKNDQIKKSVSLIAMGPGGADMLTDRAKKAIRNAQLVIGSGRVLDLAEPFASVKAEKCKLIMADEIARRLAKKDDFESAVVLYTGDLGFSSGAKGMKSRLEKDGFSVNIISGVSSVTYMLNTLGIPWEDTFMMSAHGLEISSARILKAIHEHEYFALLPGRQEQLIDIIEEIKQDSDRNIKVYIGSHLSMEDERIIELCFDADEPSDIISRLDYLVVVVFVNTTFSRRANCPYMTDDMFIRSQTWADSDKARVIPMTKEEVRSIVISRLNPKISDVIWDVGAGTGSVSIQLARGLETGHVTAFEKNAAAIELMNQNIDRYNIGNINIVNGRAPESFSEDVFTNFTPDRVFIGGAGGELIEIVRRIREGVSKLGRNPDAVRFVVTAVTIETIAEIPEIKKQSLLYESNLEVCSIAVSRGRKAGAYSLITSENCVFIITFGGIDGNE